MCVFSLRISELTVQPPAAVAQHHEPLYVKCSVRSEHNLKYTVIINHVTVDRHLFTLVKCQIADKCP